LLNIIHILVVHGFAECREYVQSLWESIEPFVHSYCIS